MKKFRKVDYFPLNTAHYNSVNKSLPIRMEYGNEGYGIYLMILQKIAASKDRKIGIEKLPAIAYDLHIDPKMFNGVIELGCDNDGEFIYDEELNESLAWYDDKYNKQSEGGKKAAAKLTPEQRKEKAQQASTERWKKNKEKALESEIEEQIQSDVNNDPMLSSEHPMLSSEHPMLSSEHPMLSDFNNDPMLSSEHLMLSSEHPMLSSEHPMLSDLGTDANNINKIEKEIKIESEPELEEKLEPELEPELEEKGKVEKDLGIYNSIQIQEEIRNYKPIYFKNSNNWIGYYFNEFRKDFEIPIPIEKFEKVLLCEYHNQFKNSDNYNQEYKIDNLIQFVKANNLVVSNSNLKLMLDIMKNPEHQESEIEIKDIIKNYK